MASADGGAYQLATANPEARNLITESSSLLRQYMESTTFQKFQEPTDRSAEASETLEKSIRLATKALELDPDSPDLAFYYASLAKASSMRALLARSTTGKSEAGTLDEAVHFSRLALRASADEKSNFRAYLWYALAVVLQQRDELHGSLHDLREAAQASRQAMDTTGLPAERVVFSQELAICLSRIYENTRGSHELEEAIGVNRQGLEIAADYSERLPFAVDLSRLLDRKFESMGGVEDLNEAILIGKQAIEAMPEIPDECYQMDGIIFENTRSPISALQFLTELLMKRHTKTGTKGDLEQAVMYRKQAVDLMPDTTHKTRLLDSFSLRSASIYSESNSGKAETISLLNRVLTTTLEGIDGAWFAISVGMDVTENPSSISETEQLILFLERQMQKFKGKLDLPASALMPMAVSRLFLIKFSKTLWEIDLERSMALVEEAIDKLTGYENEYKILYQYCLTIVNCGLMIPRLKIEHNATIPNPTVLEPAYVGKGIKEELKRLYAGFPEIDQKEIMGHRWANAALLNDHSFAQFFGAESLFDNNQVIVNRREFIDTLPENDPLREHLFCDLAEQLLRKYQATKDLNTLDESIHAARAALAAFEVNADPPWPQSSIDFCKNFGAPPGRGFISVLLSECLEAKSLATEEIAPLDEAIQVLERAFDKHGDSTSDLGIAQSALLPCLLKRYDRTKSTADLENAFNSARANLRDANLFLPLRIISFHILVSLHSYMGHKGMENLFQDAVFAIGLVPRMIVRSLESSDDTLFLLSSTVSLASNAAALALETDKDPMLALQLLESGRGVIVASLQDLRADAYDLQAKHPLVAERLTRLQKELSTPAPSKVAAFFLLPGRREVADTDQLDRRDQAVREFDSILEEIRQLPGFQSFLGSPNDSDILEAARGGPIAVINVSEIRCDAILVQRDRARSLRLPYLYLQDIKKKGEGDDLGSSDILAWLWATIACPVLHALGFIQPPSTDSDLPRIWWIPTGPLSRFPLHAAGYHGKRSYETVIDRVMSSYSCSIKAVISGRRRRICTSSPSTPGQALLVAMPQTSGYNTLRYSTDEVANVRDICKSMSLKTIDFQNPHKRDILRNLPDCKVFHFAGHAHADASNPLNSQLYLHDWKDNPLCVSDLLKLNLNAHAPFLAYLSACGTGRVRDDSYLDESTHLISAFQLAGFRHVIGTLWDADDEWSVEMSRITYEGIHEGGLTNESVCRGLHNASRTLRDLWVDKMRPEERERRYEDIDQSVTHGKRPMESPTGVAESHQFFEGEASVMNDKDMGAWLKGHIMSVQKLTKHMWEYGMLRYSDPYRQVRTVTRGCSDVDSVGSSCSLPDLDNLDVSTSWTMKPTQSQADPKTLKNLELWNSPRISNKEARASSSTAFALPGSLQDIVEDLDALVTGLGLQDKDQGIPEDSSSLNPFWEALGSLEDEGQDVLQDVFEVMAELDSGLDPGKMQDSINASSASTKGHGVNRGTRKVDRDDGGDAEEGSKGTARPHWVPYVHFGV